MEKSAGAVSTRWSRGSLRAMTSAYFGARLRGAQSDGLVPAQEVEAADPERDEEDSEHIARRATAARRRDDEQRDPEPDERERETRRRAPIEPDHAALRPAATMTRVGACLRM